MRMIVKSMMFKNQSSSTGERKVEKEGVLFKEQGNSHFKRRELHQSLHCYSKAVFISPWSSHEKQRILTELLSNLEPPKHHASTTLFSNKKEGDSMDTSLLATCIGNRSAVLYEMNRTQECLVDIELALSLNFPAASEHKLYRRQACCFAQQGNQTGAVNALETAERKLTSCASLSQAKKDQLIKETKAYHQKIEYILQDYQKHGVRNRHSKPLSGCNGHTSRSTTLDSSPDKGRFFRAVRPINSGEVVMCEEAYAAVLNPNLHLTHCSYCFHTTSALIPCCWCTSDGYCSSGCRKKAWVKYHWIECSFTHLWNNVDWMMRVALRMAVSAPAKALYEAIMEMSMENEDLYTSVLSLVAHEDKFSDARQKSAFTKMADTMMEYFGTVIKQYLRAYAESQSTQQCRYDELRVNSHSVTAVETEKVEDGGRVVQCCQEVQVGSAIFPTASLFNHSCWPNIIFRFVGSSVVVIATKPIERGEELNNCYGLELLYRGLQDACPGPQVGRMNRLERMAELQKKYFFQCSCPACSQSDASVVHREVVVDAYKCSGCGGILEERGTVDQWQCCDCHATLESSKVEKMKQLVCESENMFTAAQNALEVNSDAGQLPLLLKCHALQSQVLHKHNMQLARTSDAVAQAYACKGEFVKAAEFCAAGCGAVEAVHGSHSIELATELHKLAQLLFNSQQLAEAVNIVEKALPTLRVYLHPSHPDLIELQQMKNYYCSHSKGT